MSDKCVYCKREIPKQWLTDMFVIKWGVQIRKDEYGNKVRVKYPVERVCRPCYFYECKTNAMALDKAYYKNYEKRCRDPLRTLKERGWVKGRG